MIKTIVFLISLAVAPWAFSQTLWPNAEVYGYPDGHISVYYNGQWQDFYSYNGGIRPQPPPPPRGERCYGVSDYPLTQEPGHVDLSGVRTVNSNSGAVTFRTDLSLGYYPRKIQLRGFGGSVKIISMAVLTKRGNRYAMPSIPVGQNLCNGDAVTSEFPSNIQQEGPKYVEYTLKSTGRTAGSFETSVLYESQAQRCGGCNTFGCYLEGGGCNTFGCYNVGGGCNTFGCYTPGGGCNTFGCWYAGGSCNTFGCQNEASKDAGRMPTRPACR